jgi:exonuclease SbcC
MWTPKKLTLENFRSFVEQEYIFEKGAFLIQGVNKTDQGSSSNGSGKSSLRESLCYCLGLPTFSDTITDLINNNAKSCTVKLELYNDLTKQKLEIIRTSPLKGSAKLSIILNDEDQKDKFATVRDGDKLIIELIGISKEDLLNHYIISKEKFTSFFSSSDTKVKELISRFSNFDKVDGVEDVVQEDIDKLEEKLTLLNDEKNKIIGKLELLQEELVKELEIDLTETKNEQILELKSQISTCELEIKQVNELAVKCLENTVVLKQERKVAQKAVDVLEKELLSLKEVSFEKEIESVKEEKKEVLVLSDEVNSQNTEIQNNIKEYTKFKIEVETTIEGAIKCPKCLHEFIPNDEISVEEAKNTLPTILQELEDFEGKITKNDEQLAEINSILEEYNTKLSGYEVKITEFTEYKTNLTTNIATAKRNVQSIDVSIKDSEIELEEYEKQNLRSINDIERIQEEIKILEGKELETREKEINEKIDILAQEDIKLDESIQEQKDKIFVKEQWIHRFKKFRSSLANESLGVIQGYANMYLQKMKTNLTIELEGYKLKKDGKVSEKINPIILRDGIKEGTGNYKKFSGGERNKVDFATSVLAIQSLINNSCHTGGLDCIFSDEITEGLDVLGIENLVSSLGDLEKIVLITSHVKHEKVHENILTIEKVNGISKIV